MFEKFYNKKIFITPKTQFNEYLKYLLVTSGHNFIGFIDSYKKDSDIVNKNTIEDEDIILIFSPNYYEEIANSLKRGRKFIINYENDNFTYIDFNSFKGYKTIPKLNTNYLQTQRWYWENHLKKYDLNNAIEECGYDWGNPTNMNDPLGNYLNILNKLNSLIDKNTSILEIGTLSGKWTKFMLEAKIIYCVDINKYFIDVIKKRFSERANKFKFYISKGNELNGIKNNSIDLVFCMDTLVRVEKKYIFDYIKEISRILKLSGQAILHLPNTDIEDCRNRNFTDINTYEISNELKKYFNHFKLDSQTIVHGTLVYINC
ncbi:class I SAM-dependent methyltransferase [Halarcobacter sp.]|uniref:class I SAM-dependent methyltransferase n=1 Tax=Halarcobacter sp. TaxID=2321133 RepID=UPI002AA73707|nr:class I SAM-dependent methyltransferase [Halarcobacter sp.]